MTVSQAATYLELSEHSVYALCSARLLAHTRVGPRRGRIVISREECDRYLREGHIERGRPVEQAQSRAKTRPYVYKHLNLK